MAAAKNDEVRTELSFAFIFLIKTQPRERRLTAAHTKTNSQKQTSNRHGSKKVNKRQSAKKKKRRKIHSSSDRDEKSKKALWSSSSSDTDTITRVGGEGGSDVWTARLQRGTEKPGNGTQRARSGLKCMYRRAAFDRGPSSPIGRPERSSRRRERFYLEQDVAGSRTRVRILIKVTAVGGDDGRGRLTQKTRSFTSVRDCPERRRNANTGARSHGKKNN